MTNKLEKPTSQPEWVTVRREDRAINDKAWIDSFMQRAPFGTTAVAIDGQPFVNTNLFAYDPERQAIFLHSSDEGSTANRLTGGRPVCFTAAEIGRFLPAPRSRGFSVEYASVVAYGTVTQVEDVEGKLAGLRLLMAKYALGLQPGSDYAILQEDELAGVAVYRIDIQSWSAKRKQAPDDFPGAYRFEPVSA